MSVSPSCLSAAVLERKGGGGGACLDVASTSKQPLEGRRLAGRGGVEVEGGVSPQSSRGEEKNREEEAPPAAPEDVLQPLKREVRLPRRVKHCQDVLGDSPG